LGTTKAKGRQDIGFARCTKGLPALVKSQRIQDKARQVGFDWDHADQVMEKVEEELRELKEAAASGDATHTEEELGDVLFAVVNYARFLYNSEVSVCWFGAVAA
jgi:uncharacterized protein YabN with tetrapyrrole methylase and pyrophosphatase domain